ncbi:MAG TPA: hypothetical protein VGG57_21925 [Stellaceae bacterium]|jgi:hypothetical protein
MLSKSVVRLAFVASLMAAPAAFAASMDLPPPPTPAPVDQSMATPAPMDQSMPANPAPTNEAMTTGAPQTDVITNGPQTTPGDHGRNLSAARNVRESQQYDRLVATSPGFRSYRERKECGPITDPQMHSQCMASFDRGAESHMYGSSTPPHRLRNSAGANE